MMESTVKEILSAIKSDTLQAADLSGRNLEGVDLRGMDLRRANFAKSKLDNSVFESANLAGANFSGASLKMARLHRANLIGANVQRADLSLAGMWEASVMDADFTDANLQGVRAGRARFSSGTLPSRSEVRSQGLCASDYYPRARRRLFWSARWFASKELLLAEAVERLDIVSSRLLLSRGANANALCFSRHWPLLHEVIREDDHEFFSLLVEAGADIHTRSEDGYTPLHFAIKYGANVLAFRLVQAGADPSVKNASGSNAMDLAILHRQDAIIRLLGKASGGTHLNII